MERKIKLGRLWKLGNIMKTTINEK